MPWVTLRSCLRRRRAARSYFASSTKVTVSLLRCLPGALDAIGRRGRRLPAPRPRSGSSAMAPLAFLPHAAPLREARLVRRRDRFLADVTLEDTGEDAVAYCVNPGRMEAFSREGARIWLLPAETVDGQLRAGRRLRWTWELIEHEGIICCANTQRPNQVAKVLLEGRALPGLDDWTELTSERTLGAADLGDQVACHPCDPCAVPPGPSAPSGEAAPAGAGATTEPEPPRRRRRRAAETPPPVSRLDFYMRHPGGQQHFIEVKNCHMVYGDGNGYFPDSVSHRASRHVGELSHLLARGHRATALFVVARGDLRGAVRPSEHHDPAFAVACRAAGAAGVKFRAVVVSCCLRGLTVEREVPVDLEPYDLAPMRAWVAENRSCTGWIRSMSGQRVANGPFPHERSAEVAERRRAQAAKSAPKRRKQRAAAPPSGSFWSRPLRKSGAEVAPRRVSRASKPPSVPPVPALAAPGAFAFALRRVSRRKRASKPPGAPPQSTGATSARGAFAFALRRAPEAGDVIIEL